MNGLSTGLVAGVALCVGLGLIVLFVAPGGMGIPPCEDDLALTTLTADVTLDSNASTKTVTATHTKGEAFIAENTVRLFLRFSDTETSRTQTVTWAPDGLGTFPVAPKDSVVVSWETAARWVSSGDTVRVVWRGHETNRPDWCPTNHPVNTTFAKTTL